MNSCSRRVSTAPVSTPNLLVPILLVVLTLAPTGVVAAEESPGGDTGCELVVAAVQLAVPGEEAVVRPSFEAAIETAMRSATAEGDPDLVVFPEYTSVFPSLFPFAPQILNSGSLDGVMRGIRNKHPTVTSPLDALRLFAKETDRYLDGFWGDLARRYDTAIVAGSYFAVHTGTDGEAELRNRLLYYTPHGVREYTQDKVYPTPFELEFLNLSAGSLHRAKPIKIGRVEVAFSICNDTFYDTWEHIFEGVDLWIDIKANNADFTDEIAAVFRRALPERLHGSRGTYGLTVCLSGDFLDLFWEGPSSFIRGRREGHELLRRAASAESPDVLIARIPACE